MRAKAIMRSDIVAGARFPDFKLCDQDGARRKLSELQGQDPMILLLARGLFCPKEHRHLEQMVALHREMEVGYCRMVTISTDDLLATKEFRSALGANWPFLSDPERVVQRDLDIAEYTDAVHNPMIPHTLVLEPGLVVFKIYMGYWYFGRPTAEELRLDLRAVLQLCRPDWDIGRPELRAAWARGDRSMFYPYRTSAEDHARERPSKPASPVPSVPRVEPP